MVETAKLSEDMILKKLRGLSSERIKEVLDFLEFIELREKSKGWIEFDEWAVNLAKEKGFSHLTEDDISRIVNDFRGSL